MIIAVIALMNLLPYAPPLAHLTCLPVQMDQNALQAPTFALGTRCHRRCVLTTHTTFPPSVTTVLLKICSETVTSACILSTNVMTPQISLSVMTNQNASPTHGSVMELLIVGMHLMRHQDQVTNASNVLMEVSQ